MLYSMPTYSWLLVINKIVEFSIVGQCNFPILQNIIMEAFQMDITCITFVKCNSSKNFKMLNLNVWGLRLKSVWNLSDQLDFGKSEIGLTFHEAENIWLRFPRKMLGKYLDFPPIANWWWGLRLTDKSLQCKNSPDFCFKLEKAAFYFLKIIDGKFEE